MSDNRGNGSAIRAVKKQYAKLGIIGCEICGWSAPIVPIGRLQNPVPLLILHHIIPFAAGGSDEKENLILLCPNHATIADSLQIVCDGVFIDGPDSRDDLIEELISLDSRGGWEIQDLDECACGDWKLEQEDLCDSCKRRNRSTAWNDGYVRRYVRQVHAF